MEYGKAVVIIFHLQFEIHTQTRFITGDYGSFVLRYVLPAHHVIAVAQTITTRPGTRSRKEMGFGFENRSSKREQELRAEELRRREI